MEDFEQRNNLSEDQQEELKAFLDRITPLMRDLADSNDSEDADKVLDAIKNFETEDHDIPDTIIKAAVKEAIQNLPESEELAA